MSVIGSPERPAAMLLSCNEADLLAAAVEANAKAHDAQRGSCPADLFDAMRRVDQLRQFAARMREAGR